MNEIVVPPQLVAPKTVAIVATVLVIAALILEVANLRVATGESQNQVERLISDQVRSLRTIVELTRGQNLPPDRIKSALDRYCSDSRIEVLIELVENDSVLYRSSSLGTTMMPRSPVTGSNIEEHATFSRSYQSLRAIVRIEGQYRFTVVRTFTDINSSEGLHSALSLSVIALLLLLAPSGLIVALYWHRPARALRKHIEDLTDRSRQLPLPPIPEFSHRETDQLVKRIHSIVNDLHNSRRDALSFSAMSSHEMRTPLSLIRNYLEVALNSPDVDPSVLKMIASAYDEALALGGTVEDLLNLSTLQAGTANLNFTYFPLQEFLKSFYDEAMMLARPKDITVVLAKPPQGTMEADMARLRQVMFNLLDNAIKNTKPKGRIHISSEIQGNDILIAFSDTGRGISSENLTRIFEPFFKDACEDTTTPGVGLGLPLVKWIIESHGGSVSVKSEPGKGTAFCLRIPRYHSTLH